MVYCCTFINWEYILIVNLALHPIHQQGDILNKKQTKMYNTINQHVQKLLINVGFEKVTRISKKNLTIHNLISVCKFSISGYLGLNMVAHQHFNCGTITGHYVQGDFNVSDQNFPLMVNLYCWNILFQFYSLIDFHCPSTSSLSKYNAIGNTNTCTSCAGTEVGFLYLSPSHQWYSYLEEKNIFTLQRPDEINM